MKKYYLIGTLIIALSMHVSAQQKTSIRLLDLESALPISYFCGVVK